MVFSPFVEKHPEWIFLYGDTCFNNGCLGQPFHMGQSNTFPISVMYKVCPSASDKYFSDNQFDLHSRFILESISKVPKDGRPILPLRKIGEGHSNLSFKCPRLFEFLKEQLTTISYPNIIWDYRAN
jgi:hypothetical protein